jgi:hypothetical protein
MAAVAEMFGVLVHRLEICATTVEQEQPASYATMVSIGDADAVGSKDRPFFAHQASCPG